MGGHQQDRHGYRGQGNVMNAGNAWSGPLGGPAQEHHTPVRGFNATELKDALRKDSQPVAYKSNGKDANSIRSSGPWASKRMCFFNVENKSLC
ncbi:predicted protein [Uncinocarpus reesii 1704]|uniref:Uncharacterized protein n=1 Tax=Uncinocarpus reesii (strain UAMH 1704) TaxID=336963 RepID=C4JJR7_UNCRE|nr:uncharacterized protein UREG_01874 [Uncinocarpus reesii 1704]EEP77025.1 predicted protein [Uncinocarpus reesii 1704]